MLDEVSDTLDAYQHALEPMTAMLAADGYALALAAPADGRLAVTVVATADACEECLVPKEIFASITGKYLADKGLRPALESVYPTD